MQVLLPEQETVEPSQQSASAVQADFGDDLLAPSSKEHTLISGSSSNARSLSDSSGDPAKAEPATTKIPNNRLTFLIATSLCGPIHEPLFVSSSRLPELIASCHAGPPPISIAGLDMIAHPLGDELCRDRANAGINRDPVRKLLQNKSVAVRMGLR
jgi:hypothetical protein